MTESKLTQPNQDFLSKLTVKIVGIFGSWMSVLIHTLVFGCWLALGLNFEILLIVVSFEAIYIGILILMAENVETAQRDHINELRRQNDLKIIKHDTQLDELTRREIKQLNKQLNTLHNLITEKLNDHEGEL